MPEAREWQHNNGVFEDAYTTTRRPVKLVYAEYLELIVDAIAAERKGQVGSGDRSERIRTYNFPDGRVSDHRINLTLYSLDRIITGEIDEVVNALIADHQASELARLGESE